MHVAEQLDVDISNAELAIIPNTGHLRNMKQPQPFNADVGHFCASV
jgi:pimeloyl-ACP methyl ester carboxylesterase